MYERKGGTVLLCGSAECVYQDISEAEKLYPISEKWAVNEAFFAVKASNILTLHFEQTAWQRSRFSKFYDGATPVIHACVPRDSTRIDDRASVDFWWDHRECVGGSSGIWAASVCALIFDMVVLCGIPISEQKYADVVRSSSNFVRSGEATWTGGHATKIYQKRIEGYASSGLLGNVRSMSGFTRELLGGPDGIR